MAELEPTAQHREKEVEASQALTNKDLSRLILSWSVQELFIKGSLLELEVQNQLQQSSRNDSEGNANA
jgi:hypothetical protein